MTLRLSIVGPVHPFRGGIAHFTDTLVDGLRKRGHDIQVVTFSRQYPKLLFPGKTQFEPGQGRVASDARAVIDSVNPVSWIHAAKQIARHDPDAVLFQYWLPYFAPSYGTIAGRLKKRSIPVFALVHNVIPHERGMGDVQLGRYFLQKCEGVLALSDNVADDLRSLNLDTSIRVAAHPVYQHFGAAVERSDARTRLGLSNDAEVLLFFGFVREYKGLRTLLEAMPEIVRRRPKAVLVVAGEFYDDEGPYRDLIDAHRLDGHVRLHPEYVPADRVADYFSAANIVVQPYDNATQSGVVQTAYNFERPVVVTDVGGLAEVVPDGTAGLVVPPKNPAALADAVVRYFEGGMETRLTEGVREVRERYSWDRLLDEVEDLVA